MKSSGPDSKVQVFTMVIKEANEADKGILIGLIRDSFRDVAEKFGFTAQNCPKFVGFNAKERVDKDFKKGLRYFILEENNQICGCVALEEGAPDVCYLGRLSVLPRYRRKGYGQALVNHIFDQARTIASRRVEIGIISKDRKLKNWYRKFGFVQKGTNKFDHLPFIMAFMSVEL